MGSDDISLTEAGELRAATERLGEQVAGLSGALNTVSDLQRRQLDQERELRHLADTTSENRELGDHIVGHLDALDTKARRWHTGLLAVAGALLLVIALVVAYEHQRSTDQLHERHSLIALCEQRNATDGALYDVVVRAKPLNAQQAADQQALEKAFKRVDCSKIR